jgi:hypothetical protein
LALAYEFNQFWDAAATTKHHKFFLFQQEFFDCATLLLVQKLVDFEISSVHEN